MARILVVDDEKSIRITLRAFLRDARYEVGVAEDALGMLAAEDFDVVLSDIIMPRITGMFLLQAIKETSPHVRVILMTGEPTLETVSEAVRVAAPLLDKEVHLYQIEDQGQGFDLKKVMTTSTGLSSMQERVGLLSGVLRIETSPEHGTVAEWPGPNHRRGRGFVDAVQSPQVTRKRTLLSEMTTFRTYSEPAPR